MAQPNTNGNVQQPKSAPVQETDAQKIERLERENALLRAKSSGKLSLKIGEKGGLSVYGLGRFPVSLYKSQWLRLLDFGTQILEFIQAHPELKEKGDA